MDKFAHILRIRLIFPALLAGIICSIGLVCFNYTANDCSVFTRLSCNSIYLSLSI